MDPLIQGLLRPEAYDHRTAAFQVLETHISWVILTGEYAYKLKKPVDFGFVDFTTLERRRHFCEEEVRLNRRLAEELYLGVRPVYGPREAATFLHGDQPIEYAVKMRQFSQAAMLPAVLERDELRADHIDRLARTVATFHQAAAIASDASPYGTPDAVRHPVDENFRLMGDMGTDQPLVDDVRGWCDREFESLRGVFQSRKQAGRVRECHGDMHLGNMVLLNDEIHVFDCLEFNPRLSWTDVIAEISFLVMDFQERGQPEFAFRFLNRWLEETGDYGGLAVWKWYFAYRAMVRAKVAALRVQQPDLSPKEQDETRTTISRYLNLAESQTRGRGGPILLMHGFSGSGKSFVAERLCEELGAVRVRSDVERKRLQSTSPDSEESAASRGLYAPDQIRRVYQEILIPHAETIVSAGFPAIIDATFLRREQRDEFRRLASRLQVPLTIVDVTARLETLRRRLATRAAAARDPSDADVAVLELQKKTEDPIAGDELAETITIDTESDEWRTTLVGRLKI